MDLSHCNTYWKQDSFFSFVTLGLLSKSSKASWKTNYFPSFFLTLEHTNRENSRVPCRQKAHSITWLPRWTLPLPTPQPTSPSPNKAWCQTLEWIPPQWECEPRGNAACSEREAGIKIERGRGGGEGMETWCKRNPGVGGGAEMKSWVIKSFMHEEDRRGRDKITSSPDISTWLNRQLMPIQSEATAQVLA